MINGFQKTIGNLIFIFSGALDQANVSILLRLFHFVIFVIYYTRCVFI